MIALLLLAAAAPPQDGEPYRPFVAEASDEGAEAMTRITHPERFELSLFAAEPLLANPVCFYVADSGDVYVAETFRLHAGVTDMRSHMDWLDQELASRTVEDRVEMYRRNEGDQLDERYGVEHERIRVIRDTDGDGVADHALVFADGFADYADGIGAGLLTHGEDVYYTCMPHLWRLRDEDGDGVADERDSLSYGYGVHVALLGHDLHGLRIGPDGKLYFSCGDRGFHVRTEAGTITHPHTGAVLRCNLDGSDLEVFATGLRNPQELAFDAHGNLFTGDNNSDGGDRARFVQVVEGAEIGWRFAFQYVTEPNLRGPWNAEKLWHPAHEGQAAYILPPIANLGDGPSGLAFNPVSNGDVEYIDHFFLCDFRGDPKISGVWAFDLEPRGAGFALGEAEKFVWGTLVTDCDFGPDGALYFSDWVAGWGKTGKGRLYRLDGVTREPDDRSLTWTAQMLSEGMGGRGEVELMAFMTREDMRLRQAAHLELATRGDAGVRTLREMAHYPHDLLPRLHAVWGLGVASRGAPEVLEFVLGLMEDPDPEVRAQAARVLGDERYPRAAERLITALEDESARVRMYAAIGLGRIGDERAVEPLFTLLRETGAEDPVLRHAGIQGLVGCAGSSRLAAASADESVHARLGAVVALRRLGEAGVALFLADPDPLVVVEAARAIHDVPIDGARAHLAALLAREDLAGDALVRRVLAANWRESREKNARALAAFAMRPEAAAQHRTEALAMLERWERPSGRDVITGEWRPLSTRKTEFFPELLTQTAPALERAPDEVQRAWLRAVLAHHAAALAPTAASWFAELGRSADVRVACFETLAALQPEDFPTLLAAALADREGAVRAAALEALSAGSLESALPLLVQLAETGELAERRAAFAALARSSSDDAAQVLRRLFAEQFVPGTMPSEVRLDFELALEDGRQAALRAELDGWREAQRALHGELADLQHCLLGGDPARGERLFRERVELSCLRCHPGAEQDGAGAGDAAQGVGPDLRGVARRLSRQQLVESIVTPNARIAPGYEGLLLRLTDETVLAGRVLDEDDERLHLQDSDGAVHEVLLEEIEVRRPDLSAMPEGHMQFLDRRDLRDLIEYLCTL